MKRQARLGALYDGLRQPTIQARIIAAARSFNDLLTPAPGAAVVSADEAIAKLEAHAVEAIERTVLRLLDRRARHFPTGTLVELSTGEVAIVIATPSHPARYSPAARADGLRRRGRSRRSLGRDRSRRDAARRERRAGTSCASSPWPTKPRPSSARSPSKRRRSPPSRTAIARRPRLRSKYPLRPRALDRWGLRVFGRSPRRQARPPRRLLRRRLASSPPRSRRRDIPRRLRGRRQFPLRNPKKSSSTRRTTELTVPVTILANRSPPSRTMGPARRRP